MRFKLDRQPETYLDFGGNRECLARGDGAPGEYPRLYFVGYESEDPNLLSRGIQMAPAADEPEWIDRLRPEHRALLEHDRRRWHELPRLVLVETAYETTDHCAVCGRAAIWRSTLLSSKPSARCR